MIGRRSIRMICAGRPAPRRVLRSRGLTVVAAPANTDYTIRLENVGTGLAHGRPRRPGTDRPRHDRLPSPKLPSLCVDICTLTCDNAEESKVFLHRKSATTTGYHDGSLRWSDT
jgi:hypothetical protein